MSPEPFYIQVNVNISYDGYMESSPSAKALTFSEIIAQANPAELEVYGYFNLSVGKDGKFNKRTREALSLHGWFNAESVKDRQEKEVFLNEYFLLEGGDGMYPDVTSLDLDNLSYNQIHELAKGSPLVKRVDPKSVLSKADCAKLKTETDKIAKQVEEDKIRAARLAERRKQRKIEKAKKLLKEAEESI